MTIKSDDGSSAPCIGHRASRRSGIGAAIAVHLARDGWDVATTFWCAYDGTMPWGSNPSDVGWLQEQLAACGAKTAAVEADLSLVETPARIFDAVEQAIGPISGSSLPTAMGWTAISWKRRPRALTCTSR